MFYDGTVKSSGPTTARQVLYIEVGYNGHFTGRLCGGYAAHILSSWLTHAYEGFDA